MEDYKVIRNTVEYPLSKLSIVSECQSGVDVAKVVLNRSHIGTFVIGNEVTIYNGATKLFGGYVLKPKSGNTLDIDIESYGGECRRTLVNKVYEDKTPEYIIEDLITNYTALTYASSWVSGITLKSVIIRSKYISEIIGKICEVINWQFYTDIDKNAYFEPVGTATCAAADLVVSSNCRTIGKWIEDPKKLMNVLRLKCGSQDFTNSETFNGDGTTKEFTLAYKPTANTHCVVDGSDLVGQLQGSEGGDFSVDVENKKVTFVTAPANDTDNVIITYTYSLPIIISKSNPASIATYGFYGKKINAGWINRYEDARELATSLLTQYSSPTKTNILLLPGINTDYVAGCTKKVTDSYNSVDQNMLVRKITYKIPENKTLIEVGSEIASLLEWNKSTKEKLDELMDMFSKESTIQEYVSIAVAASVSMESVISVKTRTIGDSFIVGHPDNSEVGADYKVGWQGTAWA